MRLLLLMMSATVVGGCVFDASGLDPEDAARRSDAPAVSGDVAGDMAPAVDQPSVEPEASTDKEPAEIAPADTAPKPDQLPKPDQGGVKPLTTAALGKALVAATVQCVKSDGSSTTQQIPIVDSGSLTYFTSKVSLTGAGSDTLSWVGSKPSITILWDPNACGSEEKPGDSNWDTAGLLVRGAKLDTTGALVLAPASTVKDINLVNIEPSGAWQSDFAKPDDSDLSKHPQLVKPVAKAKQVIVTLGLP